MLNGWDIHVERSRTSWWTVKIFILNDRDFHVEQSRFSWWTVKIFMLNGWDIHVERSRISWWPVKIFILNGRDFHVEQSRFSCWTVEIFIMTGPESYRGWLGQHGPCCNTKTQPSFLNTRLCFSNSRSSFWFSLKPSWERLGQVFQNKYSAECFVKESLWKSNL